MKSHVHIALFAIALLLQITNGVAADSLGDKSLIAKINHRADTVKQYRELLASPDQNTRLAALDEMTSSNDPVMRELGYEVAFGSTDQTMRSLALYSIFSRRLSRIIVNITSMDGVPEAFAKNIGQRFALGISTFDTQTGRFLVPAPWPGAGGGQVSGLGVIFTKANADACDIEFRLAEGAILKGDMLCGGFARPIPVSVKLL